MKHAQFYSAVLASVATAILLARASDGWAAFLLWAISLTLAGASLRRPSADAAPVLPLRADRAALGLLLGVSAFLRMYRIEQLPYGLWIDELWTAHNAARLGSLPGFHPFGATPLVGSMPDWVQTSNLYLYSCWLIQSAFGFTRLGVKMLSVIPAVFAAPLFYVLSRRFFGFWPSFFAGALFAVSSWHLTLSRWGWDELFVTSAWLGAFLLLELGFQRHDRFLHFLSGLLLGLALYTYVGARLSVVAVGAVLVVRLALSRDRTAIEATGCVALGLVLTSVPLMTFWLQHPEQFFMRSNDISILPSVFAGDFRHLQNNVLLYAFMLHLRGDFDPLHHFTGDPQLDPLTGLLLLAGAALALRSWRERRSQMFVLWFAAAFAGGLFTFEAPHAYRIGSAEPACFLLAALALDAVLGAIERRSRRTLHLALVALGIAWTATAAWSFHRYFVVRPRSEACWESSRGGPALLIVERFRALRDASREVHFDQGLRSFDVEGELRLALGSFGHRNPDDYLQRIRSTAGAFWVGVDDADRVGMANSSAIFFLRTKDRGAYASRIPDLRFWPIQNPFGTTVALVASRVPP